MGHATGSETTRRGLLTVGGAALAMMAGFGGASIVVAQEGSPVASPEAGGGLEGRYAVIRLRQLSAAWPLAEVIDRIREGFVPLLEEIPGFVSYIAIADPASPRTAFLGIFADKAGADESTRVAGAWLEENGYDFYDGDPDIAEGVIELAAGLASRVSPSL